MSYEITALVYMFLNVIGFVIGILLGFVLGFYRSMKSLFSRKLVLVV